MLPGCSAPGGSEGGRDVLGDDLESFLEEELHHRRSRWLLPIEGRRSPPGTRGPRGSFGILEAASKVVGILEFLKWWTSCFTTSGLTVHSWFWGRIALPAFWEESSVALSRMRAFKKGQSLSSSKNQSGHPRGIGTPGCSSSGRRFSLEGTSPKRVRMVLGTVHGFPELLCNLLEIHPLLQKVEGTFQNPLEP